MPRMTVPGTLSRTPVTTGKGHVKSYGESRLCAVPGCSTRLSRYNSITVCWVHEQAERFSRR
jgi:hypothetical protein